MGRLSCPKRDEGDGCAFEKTLVVGSISDLRRQDHVITESYNYTSYVHVDWNTCCGLILTDLLIQVIIILRNLSFP